MTPADWSMLEVLDQMGFKAPKGKENFVAAMRSCAGVQAPGRSLPNLVPEGLGPASHLAVAQRTLHPMARQITAPLGCSMALESQPSCPDALNSRRIEVSSLLAELADVCLPQNALIIAHVDSHVRPCVRLRNITFMVECSFLTGRNDCHLFVDYVFGLPMYGWARHSSTLMQRFSRPPMPRWSDDEIETANAKVLTRVRSTGDPDLDRMAWDKLETEFTNR